MVEAHGFGGWGLNQWLWVAGSGLFRWWVLGISFSGCVLLLVGVSLGSTDAVFGLSHPRLTRRDAGMSSDATA